MKPTPPTSTLWFDDRDQLIRIDGHYWDDDNDIKRGVYYLSYDDQGRIVENIGPDHEYRYRYSTDQIEEVAPEGTYIMRLADGKVTHRQGPVERALEKQSSIDYAYDSMGRLVRHSGVDFYGDEHGNTIKRSFDNRYTYDDKNRITSVEKLHLSKAVTLTYTELADQLVVQLGGDEFLGRSRWTYTFDTNERLVRAAADSNSDGIEDDSAEYTYNGDAIEQWTSVLGFRVVSRGQNCDPPPVILAPGTESIGGVLTYTTWYDPIGPYRYSLF